MSDNRHANGGRAVRDLELSDFRGYEVRSVERAEAAKVLGNSCVTRW
jgi:phosphoketolase